MQALWLCHANTNVLKIIDYHSGNKMSLLDHLFYKHYTTSKLYFAVKCFKSTWYNVNKNLLYLGKNVLIPAKLFTAIKKWFPCAKKKLETLNKNRHEIFSHETPNETSLLSIYLFKFKVRLWSIGLLVSHEYFAWSISLTSHDRHFSTVKLYINITN